MKPTPKLRFCAVLAVLLSILLLPSAAPAQEEEDSAYWQRLRQPRTGDLPEIRERRALRALVSSSRTNFFMVNAQEQGFEFELLNALESFLNTGRKGAYAQTRIFFIPTAYDRLLPDLAAGRGDVAAAGITVTEERKKLVDFTRPYISNVREVVVTSSKAPGLKSTDDLAGRTVYVRADSSYALHLRELSSTLVDAGKAAIAIVEADPTLATEDILELVNADVVQHTVVDQHIAATWAQVLPDIRVHDDLAIHSGGEIAWAVRKNNPKLRAELDAFLAKNRKGSLLGNILFTRYFKKNKWILNPTSEQEIAKLEHLAGLFQKYGELYDVNWLALAALAYQESGLDQSKKSSAGAVGIMQIKPSTAADHNVGITGVDQLENNIHAGTKYLAFIRNRYFSDPAISEHARYDFTLAAYNAGPARIAGLRRSAEQQGLDPNRWFYNVEQAAARSIGRQTVDYVANINKYFVAYRLYFEKQMQRQLTIESLKQN